MTPRLIDLIGVINDTATFAVDVDGRITDLAVSFAIFAFAVGEGLIGSVFFEAEPIHIGGEKVLFCAGIS